VGRCPSRPDTAAKIRATLSKSSGTVVFLGSGNLMNTALCLHLEVGIDSAAFLLGRRTSLRQLDQMDFGVR
jgi:hypothetical protein